MDENEKQARLEYFEGRADGIFGLKTKEAVRKRQEANPINPNGIVDKETLSGFHYRDYSHVGEAECLLPFSLILHRTNSGGVSFLSIEAYINFQGACREAVDFYAQVFGTEKPQFMTFSEMPQGPDSQFALPDGLKDWIMHTRLTIHGSNIMFSDVFPDMPFTLGNNISLVIVTDDLEALKQSFTKLKEGGTVQMELQETFWSKCYGFVIDKFGIGWQFSLR